MDIKKIEEGLRFLDSHLAATRRFHGIETEQQVPEQPKRWWQFWLKRQPTLIDLYDQLYHRFESRLASLCAELLPVFKIFVHGDGVCINGKPGSVGWLKIEHSKPCGYPPKAEVDDLVIYFSTHQVYTYTKCITAGGRLHVNDKMELYSSPDVLLRLVGMWPEFQSGLNDWLTKLEETNRRKVNESLASLGA